MTTDPNSIVVAIYRLVSGRSDESRDWDEMRRLLMPSAMLRSIRHDGGVPVVRELTRDAWIDAAAARFAEEDFHERGAVRQRSIDSDIATLISPFAASRSPDGIAFEAGINHFAFARIEHCWRIVQILWVVWPSGHQMASRVIAELDVGAAL